MGTRDVSQCFECGVVGEGEVDIDDGCLWECSPAAHICIALQKPYYVPSRARTSLNIRTPLGNGVWLMGLPLDTSMILEYVGLCAGGG